MPRTHVPDIATLLLVFGLLLVVAALAEPLADLVRQPPSLVLAALGLAIGALAGVAAAGSDEPLLRFFADPPLSSSLFLGVFLPTLLFHAALHVDVRGALEDGVPILVLAVLAVVVATFAIGLALAPVAGLPLVACLLLGAAVATTDPVAVIAIFDSIGAPARLVRLVEGESLLNDAAAITLFVVFAGLLTGAATPAPAALARDFLVVPLGGAAVGVALGLLAVAALRLVGDRPHVHLALALALPYLAVTVAEHGLHLSSVIAVVAAGLTLSARAPARIRPASWSHVMAVWDQLGFLATALIFLLAAVVVPRLLAGMAPTDVALLAVIVVAALTARAAVLFALLPGLARAGLSPPVSRSHRLVILWGGLRGAATLALALAVREIPGVPAATGDRIAALAALFTLFTLLVQGTTMRPLMRLLRLDRLSPVDAALRDQAVAATRRDVAARVAAAAERYRIASVPALPEPTPVTAALPVPAAVSAALAATADREQALVLDQRGAGTISPAIALSLTGAARRLLDGARTSGAEGYDRASAGDTAFGAADTAAYLVYRRTGWTGPLRRRLAARFERLLVLGIVLGDLAAFVDRDVGRVFGGPVRDAVAGRVSDRREAVDKAFAALKLQYPAFAAALERRFLARLAAAAEAEDVAALRAHGLINAEVARELADGARARRVAAREPLALDLGLETRALVRATPLFADLSDGDRDELAALLKPDFVYPGRIFIRRGTRGDAAWFIASGSVEVDTGRARIPLGPGAVVGELALLTGAPRSGDVTATGYCSLLRLDRRDVQAFLDRHPEIRRQVERTAAERLSANRPGA